MTRRRKWFRRLVWCAAAFLLLGVILRITLWLSLPWILDSTMQGMGLRAEYERLNMSFTTGDLELWHLDVTSEGSDESLVDMEYCRVDLAMAATLFSWRLTGRRIEVDGMDVKLHRLADGSIPELHKILALFLKETDEVEPEEDLEDSSEIRFTLPFELNALRLQYVNLYLRDDTFDPPLKRRIDFNLRISNLGSDRRRTRFQATLSSPPIIDQMTIEWLARVDGKTLEADLEVKVMGYRPGETSSYLEHVGLKPLAKKYDFGFNGKFRTAGAEDRPGLELWFDMEDLKLEVDGAEHLALDQLKITAHDVALDSAHISLVEMEGGRVLARRLQSTDLCIAGMRFLPTGTQRAKPGARKKDHDFTWSVDRLLLRDFRAVLVDEAIAPSTTLALTLDELTIDDIQPDHPVRIRGRLSAQDLVSTIEVHGDAILLSEEKKLDLQLELDGIAPHALEPYLREAGVVSRFKDGDLSMNLSAVMRGGGEEPVEFGFALREIRLSDSDELYRLDEFEVSKATFNASANLLKIQAVEVEGQAFTVRREASGFPSAMGFAMTEKRGAPKSDSSGDGAPAGPLPRVEIGSLAFRDHRITFLDESRDPQESIRLDDLVVEMKDIVVDLTPGAAPAPPGKIEMRCTVPGLADVVTASGTLQLASKGLTTEIDINGQGINGAAAAAFFEASEFGFEPLFTRAGLHVGLRSTVAVTPAGLEADLEMDQLELREGDEELIGFERVRISGAELSADRIHVDAVEIMEPRIQIGRDQQGKLEAAGIRFVPGLEEQDVAAGKPAPMPEMSLDLFRIEGARIAWDDRAVEPAVKVSLVSNLTLEHLGFNGAPAGFRTALTVPDTGKKIDAWGSIMLSKDTLHVALEADAVHLNAGPMAAYLPEGMICTLQDGSFHAALEAGASKHPAGGWKAGFSVSDVAYRDDSLLLGLDSARVAVSRLDLESGVAAVEEISMTGLEAWAEKTEDGAMRLMGLEVREAPSKEEEAPLPVAKKKRQASQNLPLVTLDKLDLNLRKFSITDRSKPGLEPHELNHVRLHNQAPFELLGEEAENRPPLELELEGGVNPLVDSFHVRIQASPFATPALVKAGIDVKGIRGEGLAKFDERIDGSRLKDGRFSCEAELSVNMDRRQALEFNQMKRFGLDLEVKNASFRNGAEGEVLAGLDELLVHVEEVDTESGDVHIGTVELVGPKALVSREEDGLHVLGLVLKSLPAAEQVDAPPVAVESPETPGPEIRVDRIWISGVDFTAHDRASTPNATIPLNDLDLEVEGFTTRAFTEQKPIRFNMLVNAGKVILPETQKEGPLFEEITASGRIVFHPSLQGWVKAGVSALELTGFQGPAKESGVELNEGVFDAGLDLRFHDDGRVVTSAKLLFTDLSLSEPADGPITRILKLPASLDTVLFVLRDSDGAIEIPLDFEIAEEGLGAGELTTTAITTLSLLIADAVANAPFRMVDTMGSLGSLVLGGEEEKVAAEEPVVVVFEPGTVVPSSSALSDVDALIQRMLDEEDLVLTLRHELGGGDLAEAYLRANPSPKDCRDLITRLKARRIELLGLRAEAASRARAAYASGFASECSTQTLRLQELYRELGLAEQSMDRLLELMRPGAERQAVRRARDACIAIGTARLKAVHDAVKEAGVTNAQERVRIKRPRYQEAGGRAGGAITLTPGRKKVQ